MIRFSDKVIEHFQNPRNVGEIDLPEGIGTISNPVCGDITEIYLRIKDGIVEDAKFKSYGCAVTIASASVFTERIKGKEISALVSGKKDKRLVFLLCRPNDLSSTDFASPRRRQAKKAPEIWQTVPRGRRENHEKYSLPASAAMKSS